MDRHRPSPRKVAALCRDMAASCYTEEARDALLEVACDLDEEADLAQAVRAPDEHGNLPEDPGNEPLFRWRV